MTINFCRDYDCCPIYNSLEQSIVEEYCFCSGIDCSRLTVKHAGYSVPISLMPGDKQEAIEYIRKWGGIKKKTLDRRCER